MIVGIAYTYEWACTHTTRQFHLPFHSSTLWNTQSHQQTLKLGFGFMVETNESREIWYDDWSQIP
jgi:hypothetical protein